MGTGATKTNLVSKKILPLDQLKDSFLDYLDGRCTEVHERLWNDDGSFDALTTLSSPANDQLSVSSGVPWAGASGTGYTLEDDGTDAYLLNVPFENTLGVLYHVGVRYTGAPDGVETNPRTGLVQYVQMRESIGNIGNPNSVTDLGATIQMKVDSITEPGVSHAGRIVRVCLVNPLSDDSMVAFEECAVAWVAGENRITTTGLLGQTAGSVSVNPADYYVQEKGPTIQRFTSGDLRLQSGVLFLAAVTGTGPGAVVPPGSIDYTDQNVITASLIDISEIIRIDPHGRAKVRVRACTLDADEDQITVEDSTSARVFGVDEDGDIYAAGDLDIDGWVNFGSLFPASGLTFPDYRIGSANPGPGNILFIDALPTGFCTTVFSEQTSSTGHDIAVSGDFYFMGGFGASGRIDALTYGGCQITFLDFYATAPVNLSSSDWDWGSIPQTGDQSIIGSLGEQQSTSGHKFYHGVVYGCGVIAGGGNFVQVMPGQYYASQNRKDDARYAKQLAFAGGLYAIPAGSYFLYLGWDGVLYQTWLSTTAFLDGQVVIAQVDSDGMNITDIHDLRCFIGTNDTDLAVTVGFTTDTTNPRFFNFLSLRAAMYFVDWVYNGSGLWNGIHPKAEIVVNSQVTESQSIPISTPGVRIRSAQKNYQCGIVWNFDGPLFIVAGVSDVEIRDTYFLYAGPQSTTGAACVVDFGAIGVEVDRFRFLNNIVMDYNGLNTVIRGIFGFLGEIGYEFLIRDNFIWTQQQSGYAVDAAFWFEAVQRLRIEDNYIVGGAGPFTNLRYGVYFPSQASYCSVRGNFFQYWEKALEVPLANIQPCLYNLFSDNWVQLCRTGAIEVAGLSCGWWTVEGNYLYANRVAGGVAHTVSVSAAGSKIRHNFALDNYANVLNAYDYYWTGDNTLVEGNDSLFGDGGIRINGPRSIVVGNRIKGCQAYPALDQQTTGYEALIADNVIDDWNGAVLGSPGVGVAITRYGTVFVGNRVEGGTNATYAVYVTASIDVDIIGNSIEVNAGDAGVGTLGIWWACEGGVIVGNMFKYIGDGINGGMGIWITAGGGRVAITGNMFDYVRGHAMYFSMASLPSNFTGNICNQCGLAGVVNPLTGGIQLDTVVTVGSNDHVICSNLITTSVVGAWGVTLNAGCSNCIAQLNRCVCPGGNVRDIGATNMIGASAVNNNL